MSDANHTIQVHIPPELEYCYRDIANIYVGHSDVVFEFGNRHRSTPEHATIANRVVMSFSDAYELQERLAGALQEARQKLEATL